MSMTMRPILQVRRSTILARRGRSEDEEEPESARVRVGADVVRTGMSGGAVGMAVLAGVALGGMVFLVTAKPLYAGIALLGGLFVGSRLGSETGA